MSRRCRGCGAALGAAARFCAGCGRPTTVVVQHERRRSRAESSAFRRAARVLAIGFVGAFASTILSRGDAGCQVAGDLVVLGAAFVVAGPALARASLGRRCAARECLLALPAGLLTFAVALGYVALLDLAGGSVPAPEPSPWLQVLAEDVLAPAVVEEVLCRGLMFIAARELAGSQRGAILLSALLFGFLHGLNGAALLEVPHRLVGGLVFGWLRARSGSLVPGMLAHGLHNALAGFSP